MPITPGSATKLNPVIGLSTALTLTVEDIADSAKMSKVLPKGILVSFPNGNVALTDGSAALNALNPIVDQLLTETEKLALLHTFSGTNETYRAVEGGFLVLGADGKMAPAGLPQSTPWNMYKNWTPETGGELVQLTFDAESFIQFYISGALTHKAACMAAGIARKNAVKAALAAKATAAEIQAI